MVIRTVITNISISVAVLINYRTTKGGKRILTRDPGYSLNCILEIEYTDQLHSGDVVFIDKTRFVVFRTKDKFILKNAIIAQHEPIQFRTGQDIEVHLAFRAVGESSK